MWDTQIEYVVIVAPTDEPLFHYLQAQFKGDPFTLVIFDRRRRGDAPDGSASLPEAERRQPRSTFSSLGVTVIRLTGDRLARDTEVHEQAGRRPRATMEGIEDRQRVDRWLEESQYLIGRMIPAYLDDRERLRGRLQATDQDNERLKAELADARREIAELRGDLEFHRGERARIAESFHAIVEQLTAIQAPISDISSRLQPIGAVAAG